MSAPSYPPLSLHPDNPHYFLFRGKPAVLITSGEHYGAVINLDFDYRTYLDTLHGDGLNHTRLFVGGYRELPDSFGIQDNTLGPQPGRYVGPFARSVTPGASDGGAKFDLDSWDPAYFQRLHDFLRLASERGIVVEACLFGPYYVGSQKIGRRHWELAPWHPANNINGLPAVEPAEVHTLKVPAVLRYQEALVRKIVGELNGYDNLYFEICNEPYFDGVTEEWQRHIADAIMEAERDLPCRHLISQNVANRSKVVADPYPAISILNFHYARPPRAVAENYGLGKAIGCNETGFDGPEDDAYRSEAWEFILAGGALFSHLDLSFTPGRERGTLQLTERDPSGGGPALRKQMGVLKEFIHSFDLVRMVPDRAIIKDLDDADAGYVLAEHGQAYAVYVRSRFPRVTLTLHIPAGLYRVEWVNTRTGAVDRTERIEHRGGFVRLASPAFRTDVALRIVSTARKAEGPG